MGLKKSQHRPTDPGDKKQKLTDKLDKLWDTGSPDVVKMIETNRFLKKENIGFYKDQKDYRLASIMGKDKILQGQ